MVCPCLSVAKTKRRSTPRRRRSGRKQSRRRATRTYNSATRSPEFMSYIQPTKALEDRSWGLNRVQKHFAVQRAPNIAFRFIYGAEENATSEIISDKLRGPIQASKAIADALDVANQIKDDKKKKQILQNIEKFANNKLMRKKYSANDSFSYGSLVVVVGLALAFSYNQGLDNQIIQWFESNFVAKLREASAYFISAFSSLLGNFFPRGLYWFNKITGLSEASTWYQSMFNQDNILLTQAGVALGTGLLALATGGGSLLGSAALAFSAATTVGKLGDSVDQAISPERISAISGYKTILFSLLGAGVLSYTLYKKYSQKFSNPQTGEYTLEGMKRIYGSEGVSPELIEMINKSKDDKKA